MRVKCYFQYERQNTLNSFTNLFPQNLDLKNREWEIGIVSIGLHYNYDQQIISKGQPGFIVLKNKLTSINSLEEDIRVEISDQMKSIWVLPDVDEDELMVNNLMLHLHKYIYKEGMRMSNYDVNKKKIKKSTRYKKDQKNKRKMKITIMIDTC